MTFGKLGLEYNVGDGTALPVEDSSCDVFVSLETIEHIEDDRGHLSEINRVLRPGGLLLCSTPNRLITNPGTTITDPPWNRFHLREYSLDEFTGLVRKHFDIELILGQNRSSRAAHALLGWLAHLIGTKSVVRLRQIWKCRWFILDSTPAHTVQSRDVARCEYLVIVARKPAA
jgi:SAM-dependent methyltransferase